MVSLYHIIYNLSSRGCPNRLNGLPHDVNRVYMTIQLAHDTLIRAGIPQPKIAVCGMNPHAGENGLFGHGEEEEKIVPAVERRHSGRCCLTRFSSEQ